MTVQYPRRATVLLLAIAATACSPALNWRDVPLEGLIALLPCKPDHAERKVQLGSTNSGASNVVLQVSGCEASGALYAISHIHVAGVAQVQPMQAAWRQTTLNTLQVVTPTDVMQAQPLRSGAAAVTFEKLEGKRPDGSPLQAQLTWLTKGQDIYLVAVYGPKLDTERTELLFSELRLP